MNSNTIPDHLYKYKQINEYTISSLLNDQIYFADPDSFNDPFDSYASLNFGPEFDNNPEEFLNKFILDSFEKDHQEQGKFIKNAVKEIIQKGDLGYLKKYFLQLFVNESHPRSELFQPGIFCITPNNDDLLMWAHYGDEHKGICIKYNTSYPPFNIARKVEYQEDFFKFEAEHEKIIDDILEPYFFKSPHWDYEDEYRILHKSPGVFTISPKTIDSIYFGLRCSLDNIKIIKMIMHEKSLNIKLYKARKSLSNFKIDFDILE